ncbi:heat stress transcription factor C-1-like [Rutidosis leptorrhynchoides]|uniref:heat stress transcription factor C-1-like n=1 Tax=Rutidosis leptorrhynchoides TaxID=125765 RepID=UPI003A9A1003
MESKEVIAPFVMKTYQMVNDSSLDSLIRWGTSNNTFIVVDSLDFSQRLLPAFFKHNNFSSFIRQLNTYGFRKVDPDRWEFANEWFLRGQVHLLKNIGRKKQSNCKGKYSQNRQLDDEDEDEEEMLIEIARLKQEQKELEQELVTMNKRLEATEKRPEQMMALLCKVAEDPDILSRMMLEKNRRSKRLVDKKRQRGLNMVTQPLLSQPSSSIGLLNNPIKIENGDHNQTLWRPQPSQPSSVWLWNKDGCDDDGCFSSESKHVSGISKYNVGGSDSGGGGMIYFGNGLHEPEVIPAPAYPFSLLGGGFSL